MWRYLVGAVAALLLAGAGVLLIKGSPARGPALPAMPATVGQDEAPLPDEAPAATAKTREQRRFNRYDKDRDGAITRDEYLVARRKAYARLDTNGDGRLSFDEWGVKAIGKFATADADKSGAMNAKEFATTAVKRKPKAAVKCVCPAVATDADD
ncbi:MAG: EF-hand domain-containing protein [Pseudomonadota bacterium]